MERQSLVTAVFVVCYCIVIAHCGGRFIGIISQINLTISKLISVINYYYINDCITKLN